MTYEQELLDLVSHMDEKQRNELLTLARRISQPSHPLSAREILKLTPQERERIVSQAFAHASTEDFEIFEAYSEEDVDGSL